MMRAAGQLGVNMYIENTRIRYGEARVSGDECRERVYRGLY